MIVYWLPYLRLAYPISGSQEYRIGKAVFVEDSETNWSSILGRPRPKHLEIYRDFPEFRSAEIGEPLFGTLVRSDDHHWLDEHIDEAVAVLHFLGDCSRQFYPSECFAYLRLEDKGDPTGKAQLISFSTKQGRQMIESAESLKLHPPLAVRACGSRYGLFPQQPENDELLGRISDDPHDRLVVSVRQYFRAQFSDIFTSPVSEDVALYCGAIEAALNLDSATPGVADRFVDALTNLFGGDERFKDFFRGFYVARSVYVHGLSTGTRSAIKDFSAYKLFTSVPARLSVLRAVARDVICQSLGARPSATTAGTAALTKALHSTRTWHTAKKLLTKPKAANALSAMSDEGFASVRELRHTFENHFEWWCVDGQIDQKQILAAIGTCALVIAKLTGSQGDVYTESDRLGRWSDAGNIAEIQQWILHDPWRRIGLLDDRLSTMQRLMRAMAKFFDRHNIVRWSE